ncbi:6-carboxytetrahydropterin synthase [Congregibacter brevis]|uniref:6-carboxy-5,6,7,8-tetrahydropterin synthase n=1 Tax=Congregibacter brevis TaxID=3081201 RepID=A0ABZ0IC59_9GAMM|nr:6-carboxytetrahydropterin synthase [Congregibacter sp. IMCC45268]
MERLATLYIDKESHKFSAAHYTIFSATERERLHGHNYSVSAMIAAPMGDNGFAADYNVYKRRIKALCDELDEYMVLPKHSPHQSVVEDGENYRVVFNGEELQFLRSDTLLLPIVNATVEEFAHYLLGRMLEESAGELIAELQVCVASGPGQKGCASWSAMDDAIA